MVGSRPHLPTRPAPRGSATRRGGGGGRMVCSAVPPEPASAGGKSRGDAQEARQRPGKTWQQQAAAPSADWQWQRSSPPPRRPSPPPQQQQGVWTSQPRGPPPGGVDSFYPRRQVAQAPGGEASLDRGYGGDLRGSPLGRQSSLDASLDFPNLSDEFDAAGSDDEEGLQQRRQWRQRTLRSLWHDLRAGGGAGGASSPGRAAGGAGSVSDSDSDAEYFPRSAGLGRPSRGGAGPRGDLRDPTRSMSSSSSRGCGSSDGGMAPPGLFLQTLQDAGVVDEGGQPTELGRRQGVGFSSHMNVCINKLLAYSTDLATILSIVRDTAYLMDAINASTAMHRLGKVVRRQRETDPGVMSYVLGHPLYHQLLVRVQELAPNMMPRALANTVWGLAALGDVERLEVGALLLDAVPRHPVDDFQPQELSNIVWAMGTLGLLREAAVDHLLAGAEAHMDAFIPQALSNMVWACAHLRNGTRGCLAGGAAGGAAGSAAAQFVPREARPGWQPSPAFLQAVAATSTRLMPDFQSQSMSNLLWGFCKLDVYPQELFEAAAAELVERFRTPELARQFRAQELSNSLYAFAQGNIINEQLLSAFERELSASWLEIDSSGRERRVSRLDDFTSQALANTLWSFANLRWYPVLLLEPITRAVGRKLAQMSPQEISNSVWSYAKFAYHPGPVMAQYQVEIGRRVPQFSGQSLTTMLWAMAALSATHCEGFVRLVDRFVELERQGCFQEVQYNQVLQAVLLAQFEMQRAPGDFRPEIDLPDDIVDRALQAWQAQQQAAKLSSFQLEVSSALGALGIEHEIEHLTAVNLLSVDIAIISGGRKLAIEVDGPFHFSVNTNSPLGQTMIRRRLLRAVGWTVISVPYHTWYKMPPEARPSYLSRLLVRKDGSFHDAIMKVSEDLLSTDFKKGLGREAGADALREDEDTAGGGGGGGRDGRGPLVPRNLGKLLEREGLMLTKSAARRLVNMGFAERVAADADNDALDTFHARRQQPSEATKGRAPSGSSSSSSSGGGSSSSGGSLGRASSFDEAGSGSADPGGTALDAILEAARAAREGDTGAAWAGPGGAVQGAGSPGAVAEGGEEAEARRPLQVDLVDTENPLRPRYTDFAGNVLEGIEPYNLLSASPQPWRRPPSPSGGPPLPPRASASVPPPSSGLRPPERRNPMARPPPPGAGQPLQQSQQQQQPRPPAGREQAAAAQAAAAAPTTRAAPPRLVRPVPLLPQGRQDPRPWQLQQPAAAQGLPAPERGGQGRKGAMPPAPPSIAAQRRALSTPTGGAADRRQRQQAAAAAAAAASATPSAAGPSAGSHVVQLAAKLSLAELRRLCESKALPAWGTKAQLAGRLVAHSQEEQGGR
ncbi:hypothetical protein ABPG75_002057 [Micractinium tetrahymenae]